MRSASRKHCVRSGPLLGDSLLRRNMHTVNAGGTTETSWGLYGVYDPSNASGMDPVAVHPVADGHADSQLHLKVVEHLTTLSRPQEIQKLKFHTSPHLTILS